MLNGLDEIKSVLKTSLAKVTSQHSFGTQIVDVGGTSIFLLLLFFVSLTCLVFETDCGLAFSLSFFPQSRDPSELQRLGKTSRTRAGMQQMSSGLGVIAVRKHYCLTKKGRKSMGPQGHQCHTPIAKIPPRPPKRWEEERFASRKTIPCRSRILFLAGNGKSPCFGPNLPFSRGWR